MNLLTNGVDQIVLVHVMNESKSIAATDRNGLGLFYGFNRVFRCVNANGFSIAMDGPLS